VGSDHGEEHRLRLGRASEGHQGLGPRERGDVVLGVGGEQPGGAVVVAGEPVPQALAAALLARVGQPFDLAPERIDGLALREDARAFRDQGPEVRDGVRAEVEARGGIGEDVGLVVGDVHGIGGHRVQGLASWVGDGVRRIGRRSAPGRRDPRKGSEG
jgi:hypothetical protein